jgi:hypothetical protein
MEAIICNKSNPWKYKIIQISRVIFYFILNILYKNIKLFDMTERVYQTVYGLTEIISKTSRQITKKGK